MDPQRMFGMTPWVRRLIVANLVVFLLQVTLFVSPGFVATLGFAPLSAFRQPWTFFTYMFVHANLLHLAFNLLALYVFGPEVEERMGGGAFVRYYLLCGLGGAVLSLVLGWSFGRLNPVVGASATGLSLPKLHPSTRDRKSTRLNSSHQIISYAVFCLKKKI